MNSRSDLAAKAIVNRILKDIIENVDDVFLEFRRGAYVINLKGKIVGYTKRLDHIDYIYGAWGPVFVNRKIDKCLPILEK